MYTQRRVVVFGLVWFGLVWFGLVWFGLVWFGLVWFGLARLNSAWLGSDGIGSVWLCVGRERGGRPPMPSPSAGILPARRRRVSRRPRSTENVSTLCQTGKIDDALRCSIRTINVNNPKNMSDGALLHSLMSEL